MNQEGYDTFKAESVVDVVCITYNHEKYIRQALDSFLMQKTSFPFRILVSDDVSTDATRDILREYAERSPGKVVPIFREENCGGPKNLRLTCQASHAKYVALCEGDDWWTDPCKLQKQYDVMEAHPDAAVCFHDVEIVADRDWYLRSYYRKDARGRMLIPAGIPGFRAGRGVFSAHQYFNDLEQAHTSTLFYRWDPNIPFLPEYDQLFAGDSCLLMMHLSRGDAYYIPEAMSAYRKTSDDESAIAFDEWAENARTLQLGNVEVCEYLRAWYMQNSENRAALHTIDDKLELSMRHYLRQMLRDRNYREAALSSLAHPRAALKTLGKSVSRRLAGPKSPFVKLGRSLFFFVLYWVWKGVKKDPKLWVTTSFQKRGYLDNTRYFYEWVRSNRPDIRMVWLTEDRAVFNELAEQGLPVAKMKSKEGRALLKHASVAVVDHFRRSDFNTAGFNGGTKVVQLWHGVGIKDMGGFSNTKVRGVRYDDDILAREEDGLLARIAKCAKRFVSEPFREMHENYLFFLVANGHDKEGEGGDWHLPPEKMFVCGYPRNAVLEQVVQGMETQRMIAVREKSPSVAYRVLYAPTYRFNEELEHRLVQMLCDAAPRLQALMEKHGGEFYIRLHPHTWRDYSEDITWAIRDCPRIFVDTNKDVYATLGLYDALVSDYSSLATDYLILDRPMVFFRPDHEEYLELENKMRRDPDEFCPGEKTRTWEETVAALEAYLADPSKDADWRARIKDFFFDPAVNDVDNSARVAAEIERRLEESAR